MTATDPVTLSTRESMPHVTIVRRGTEMLGAITEHVSASLNLIHYRAVAWELLPHGGTAHAGTATTAEDARDLILRWHEEHPDGNRNGELPWTARGESSQTCLGAGLVCSIDPATLRCTECGADELGFEGQGR